MSDEKLPPGWVRLTGHSGEPLAVCAERIDAVLCRDGEGALVATTGNDFVCAESPAEVLARIAEAMRARRRFDALPGMAATLVAGRHYQSGTAGQIADAILEATEASDE